MLLLFAHVAQAACDGPAPAWVALGGDVWLLQGEPGEPSVANRGRVANQVLARDGPRLWLIGAGPTPAAARALACHVRQRFGRPVSDVVVPWARGEQALGQAGWPGARIWAHEAVAATMQRQCTTCLAQLRQRLQAAAADLGAAPIRIPPHRLQGDSGRLGPWTWWRLARGEGQSALLLRHRGQPMYVAPGWLWADRAPDARGADVAELGRSAQRMVELSAGDGDAARWIGEQGPPLDATAPRQLSGYWQALQAAATEAVRRGDTALADPPALPGVPAAWQTGVPHQFNWQRAWRQAEDALFEPPR